MKNGKNNIDTGKLLRGFVEKNKITNAGLSRDINRNATSIFKYKENVSIQTGILIEICHATKHNFFQDIANLLPKDFTVTNDLKAQNEIQLIAQHQEEINSLKNEMDVMKNEMLVLRVQNELLMKLKG